jgi:hypothetical protein
MAVIKRQLRRVSQGKSPHTNDSPLWSLLIDQYKTKQRTKRYRHIVGLSNH